VAIIIGSFASSHHGNYISFHFIIRVLEDSFCFSVQVPAFAIRYRLSRFVTPILHHPKSEKYAPPTLQGWCSATKYDGASCQFCRRSASGFSSPNSHHTGSIDPSAWTLGQIQRRCRRRNSMSGRLVASSSQGATVPCWIRQDFLALREWPSSLVYIEFLVHSAKIPAGMWRGNILRLPSGGS
jgi:hypothetical protein